ncbi:MAG: DotA/TraY family protein [Methylotenera sp.]|uniref:DotA/TraY family protein n=1 Tax=Methylotenera sp. TaxID=2051956 RepID=UPI00272F13A2|nr:DotA/TraY family protein [Methylotenera sp.]MDP1521664.1 DotA/TraY family protein [Methylotenera sp.]
MKKLLKYLIGFSILALPALAFAQFDPPADDISIKILDQLFGGLFNGGRDQFGDAIGTFNAAILIIGGLLASYTVLAGTLGTAHDGEMLGKKFSSVWIPIRYSVGTALVLPVLPGGYCLMMKLVAICISMGVGLAGSIWDSYITNPTVNANITFPTSGKQELTKVAENMFAASVCVAAHKRFIQETPEDIRTILNLDKYDFKRGTSIKGNAFYGYGTGIKSRASCGYVNMPKNFETEKGDVPNHNNAIVNTNPASTNPGYLGPLDNIFKSVDLSPMTAASQKATTKMIESMEKLANEAVADDKVRDNAEAYYSKIELAATTYMTDMQTAALSIPQSSEANEKKYGWILAGAYFNNIVHNNNKLHEGLTSYPVAVGAVNPLFTNQTFADANPFLIANDVLNASKEKNLVGATAGNQDESVGSNDDGFGISAAIGNKLSEIVSGVSLFDLKNDSRHPVIIVNEMGNRILTVWTGALVATTAISAAASAAKEASQGELTALVTLGFSKASGAASAGTLGVLNTVMQFLFIPISALMVVGFTCAYLIPMIPFIIWLGCIGGWLIQCVIALLAAPLWAIMHLHPNGDDLTGRGGNGYTMLLGLLLRPALLIFGFIASIAMSAVLGEFINKIYFQVFAFSGQNVNGWMAFISLIAGTVIYAVIMFAFVNKTHAIMHIIPDELLKWIGGGGDALGSYAKEMTSGAERGAGSAAASAGVGGFVGAGIGKKFGEATGKLKESAHDYTKMKNQEKLEENNKNLDENFGGETSEKKANALGFSQPKTNADYEKSSAYDSALNSIKVSGVAGGVEKFQNQMISSGKRSFEDFDFSAKKAISSIASKIMEAPNSIIDTPVAGDANFVGPTMPVKDVRPVVD